jgi:hypothetical protein
LLLLLFALRLRFGKIVVRFYLATPAGIIRRDGVQIHTLLKEKRTSNDVLFSFGGVTYE